MSALGLNFGGGTMWRWVVPLALTACAVTSYVVIATPYTSPPHGDYLPGGVTFSWLTLMAIASPTILYYRLLILAGERAWRLRPRIGAALFVLAGALLPPLLHAAW